MFLIFFDELAFYVKGDQITPETAHQSFYYWIEGYYNSAREYIEYYQKESPTVWEHVKYLYDITSEVEKIRSRSNFTQTLDDKQVNSFLESEREGTDATASNVSFEGEQLRIHLTDGRTIGVPCSWFPRLQNATPQQREAVEIGRFGLHWEEIDEDISIAGLLAGGGINRPSAGRPKG
jgi:hypothetical protein